ncbi:L-rhamnose mutarotase [Spirosomataceae bacterium TFI 002]|nr:L-rhamnose mutarotase [Spirosomataceae bacterium TFI 002]
MKKYCLTCDLVDDPQLIEKYKWHHKPENQRPHINQSIRDKGVTSMEIYLFGNRMFMIMEVNADFSFEKAAQMDQENPDVVEWENLMWGFQKEVPGAKPGEKWVLMDQIFKI